jgi:hypothetical protein
MPNFISLNDSNIGNPGRSFIRLETIAPHSEPLPFGGEGCGERGVRELRSRPPVISHG